MTTLRLSVLLVEDNDAYARLLDVELGGSGPAVLQNRVRSLAEAIAAIRASAYDVVLLDLGLPDTSGLDTLRELRRAAPDLPVVVLTARDDDELAIAALQSGAEDYLVKSDTDGELVARALRYAWGASDLWRVRADAGQIEQVLMNLCANARDAMPEGGRLEIVTANTVIDDDELQRRPGLPPGPYVLLTVEDSGHGMSEKVRDHVFEPFFTTKEQGRGTGLGLAMVYGIVKQSGGGTYVESVEEKGTRVLIYLPQAGAPI